MATPNMLLTLPVSGVTTAWGDVLNTALTTVDSHDHTVGRGARVPIAGLSTSGTPSAATFLRGDGVWAGLSGDVSGTSVTATGTPTPRTLADRAADVVNVLDFGAVGDGVTDDTAALQLAISMAEANGGKLTFRGGETYKISTRLTITKGIEIDFAGCRILQANSAEPGIYLAPSADGLSPYLHDLFLQGGTIGLHLYRPSGYVYKDARFQRLDFSGHTFAGVKIECGVISTHWSQLNFEEAGCQYGIYASGNAIVNATQWHSIRINGPTSSGIYIEEPVNYNEISAVTVVGFTGEAIVGSAITLRAVDMTLVGAHFEQNGTANRADIELGSPNANSITRLRMMGGYFSTHGVGQTESKIKFLYPRSQLLLCGTRFLAGDGVNVNSQSGSSAITMVDSVAAVSNPNGLIASALTYSGLSTPGDAAVAGNLSVSGTGTVTGPLASSRANVIGIGIGTTATSTGININGGNGGGTALLLVSRNTGSGNATASAVYLLRYGYDGNNYATGLISGTDFITFSLSGSILQAANAAGGTCRLSVVANVSG